MMGNCPPKSILSKLIQNQIQETSYFYFKKIILSSEKKEGKQKTQNKTKDILASTTTTPNI